MIHAAGIQAICIQAIAKALNRCLAVVLALAVAFLPSALHANCGDRHCECDLARSACCHRESLRSCCGGESCGPVSCTCEVRRSDSPPIPQQHHEQRLAIGGSHAMATAYTPRLPQESLQAHGALEPLRPAPALRILYCVWRN